MQLLREHLPTVLVGAGGAVAVACLLMAALSLSNPLIVLVLLVAGVGAGALLAGVGLLVDNANRTAAYTRQLRSDVRATARTLHELLDDRERSSS